MGRRKDKDESPVQGGFVGNQVSAPVAKNPIQVASSGTSKSGSGTTSGTTRTESPNQGFTYVDDRPGYGTNYAGPSPGAGWDRGASASSLSSMGDHKQGGPNHVIVRNEEGRKDDPIKTDDPKPNPDQGPDQDPNVKEAQRRAANRALLAEVRDRPSGSHHVAWGSGAHFQRPTSTTLVPDRNPRQRNTGLLGTLEQNKSATLVQSSKTAAQTTTKEKEMPHCKTRPKDNKPKGGGGSGKSFVPWCG